MAAPQVFVKCMFCSCMSGPFKALTNEELALVDKNRTELTYRKGELLCKQGAFISNTIFIKKGLVKIYLESNDHPIILSLEKDGYFIKNAVYEKISNGKTFLCTKCEALTVVTNLDIKRVDLVTDKEKTVMLKDNYVLRRIQHSN